MQVLVPTGKLSLASKTSSDDHSIPGHCVDGVGGKTAAGGGDSVCGDAMDNRYTENSW